METTITIRIDPEVKKRVTEWAKKKGLKRSYAYEIIFNNGLEVTGQLKTKNHEH